MAKNVYWRKNPRTYTSKIHFKCDWCGKECSEPPSCYNISKNHFCSVECRQAWYANVYSQREDVKEASRQRALRMLHNGEFPKTMTKPHRIIDALLSENKIKHINEKTLDYYSADIYLEDSNLIIQIMGDYWHASPIKYTDKNMLNKIQRRRVVHDEMKQTYINNCYDIKILYLWEHDIYFNLDLCEKIINEYIQNDGYIKNYHSFNYIITEQKNFY